MTLQQELDRALAELAAERELNRRIIEALPGGIVHVSAAGAVIYANADAQRILGLSYNELTQKYVEEFSPETINEDGTPCPAEHYPVVKCLQTGQAQPEQTIGIRRPDGGLSWAVFRAIPLREQAQHEEHANVVGAVVTFVDITQRKEAEIERLTYEQRKRHTQKLEAIGTLAGGIAHEFNNLLQAMIGNTELMSMTLGNSAPIHDELDRLLGLQLRARDLVANILAFSRRKEHRQLSVCSLQAAIDEATGLLRPTVSPKIAIVTDVDPDTLVTGDHAELQQVLVNLGANASQAIGDHHGTVTIRCRPQQLDETRRRKLELSTTDCVCIEVTDTGSGIEASIRDRVFEPFFTTKPIGRGTGMGLAIVHGIVSDLGGTIQIESELNTGTTFRILLPRAKHVSTDSIHTSSPRSRQGIIPILFVDDEPEIVAYAQRWLAGKNIRVAATHSGQSALELFRADPDQFKLILTDYSMPGMTGAELAERLLAIKPDIPVIVATGYNEGVDVDMLTRIGVKRLVRKPLIAKEMVDLIQAEALP